MKLLFLNLILPIAMMIVCVKVHSSQDILKRHPSCDEEFQKINKDFILKCSVKLLNKKDSEIISFTEVSPTPINMFEDCQIAVKECLKDMEKIKSDIKLYCLDLSLNPRNLRCGCHLSEKYKDNLVWHQELFVGDEKSDKDKINKKFIPLCKKALDNCNAQKKDKEECSEAEKSVKGDIPSPRLNEYYRTRAEVDAEVPSQQKQHIHKFNNHGICRCGLYNGNSDLESDVDFQVGSEYFE